MLLKFFNSLLLQRFTSIFSIHTSEAEVLQHIQFLKKSSMQKKTIASKSTLLAILLADCRERKYNDEGIFATVLGVQWHVGLVRLIAQ